MAPMGRKRWAIAEGYIPTWSHGPKPAFESHETACILNTGDADAHVTITILLQGPGTRGALSGHRRRTAHAPLALQ